MLKILLLNIKCPRDMLIKIRNNAIVNMSIKKSIIHSHIICRDLGHECRKRSLNESRIIAY